ncbi:hypothetical protein DIPPA_00083 [Diplonema papillatum]|nr:hypothetical protein DIPPA_01232 [Diplonema papillatum]KAJ9440746.1 hypothetical protein DIPPA_10035 [Diplonema papillatum]KAJ9451512.1 hypothetical protein DIPPA_35476 [Diplonema papillatum]KAJ9457024.1 hypothetical protein DIPPA_33469 [Diplonema papillatum]KAJ9469711.1 hypothetical protein DIPPA_00083 [Diplonema papillatum]
MASWEGKIEKFESLALASSTRKQRLSMEGTLEKFTQAAGLRAAPASLRIKAFAAAMLDGMSGAQLARYTAREAGRRGRPRTGKMRTVSVEQYVSVLGSRWGVPAADLAKTKRAILKRRLERRETPSHAVPLSFEEAQTIIGVVSGDEELAAAATLLWSCALRMADLTALRSGDVTMQAPGIVRIAWWTSKEASLRLHESEVSYRLPLNMASKVRSWLARRGTFGKTTAQTLLRIARNVAPACSGHSWKRGALQHLARGGADWEELLLLARHTSVTTLRRYLWGCVTPDHRRTERLSAHLHAPVR